MTGLTTAQVQDRVRRGQVNEQVDSTAMTTADIIRENLFTYFNFIFFVIAVLLIAAGAWKSLTFLPIVISNALIGIVQQLYAKKVLDRVSVINETHAVVIRDGQKVNIPIHELVTDDIILLESGNQIPADAVVLQGNVNVNESLLTGEADEIEKMPGKELMSGSFVVSGTCYAKLTHVGSESYISKLMTEAKNMNNEEESEMVRSINMIVKLAGFAILPIGILLFVQGYFLNHQGFSASIISMVAAVIGMIPEGLYLLVSVTLALGATRLARKKVMLHDMKSIETLARVNVLCVDKTGTITENNMVVKNVAFPGTLSDEEQAARRALCADYIRALPDNNITMQAMRNYFTDQSRKTAAEVMPFSSRYKFSSVRFEDGIYLLGAPDIVLGPSYERYRSYLENYASEGLRSLVLASMKDGTQLPRKGLDKENPPAMVPVLFILLENPIRENAKQTFSYFREQGVEIKVISGDNPVTVSNIADRAGIENAQYYIDATTLTTKEAISDAVSRYTVFGRVTPEQKRYLVEALQEKGNTVAMTGDGVNDILAMKDADCSVAMAAGSDAAVQAAQVVLLDSDFSRMPEIVAEGRRIINNIERSATLFTVKNMFSFFLAIFSIINVMAYPLQPEQVSLISGFNIGIPAFFLALEPNHQVISGHFLPKVLLRSFPAALTDFFVIAAMVVFGNTFGVSTQEISVASTMLLAIVGFMILYYISRPLNKYRFIVILGCVAGMAFTVLVLHKLFSITAVSIQCIMLLAMFAVITEPCMRYLVKLCSLLEAKCEDMIDKKMTKEGTLQI